MGEGLSASEVGKEIAEHRHHTAGDLRVCLRSAPRDACDLLPRLLDRRRAVNAEHAARPFLPGEAGHPPGLRP